MELSVECLQAQKDIQDIENNLSNPTSILHRTLLGKGEVLRLLATSYEILFNNGLSKVPVNGIASHILKRVSEINTNLSKSWIYESLPAKYKTHRLNNIAGYEYTQSVKRTESSSIDSDYESQNFSEIDFYNTQIILCKKLISHLKTHEYITKIGDNGLTVLNLEEYDSDLVIRTTSQDFVLSVFDNRKTVTLNTIHLLLQAFFDMSNKYAAGLYVSKLKEFGIQKKKQAITQSKKLFTPKQLRKILKGETKEIHQSFEIVTSQEAYENGFYGKINCSECGSWRVKLQEIYNYTTDSFSNPLLHCFSCLEDTRLPKVMLPLT